MNGAAPTPELEEADRDGILCIVGNVECPRRVSQEAPFMTFEEARQTSRVIGEHQRPIGGVIVIHTC